MLRILAQALRTGLVTEPAPACDDAALAAAGIILKRRLDERLGRSLAIRMVDAGSCNGCELEVHALNNPYYDLERFGIQFVASPRHADALMVSGPVSRHMETALRRTWRATPSPKLVIAIGDCACGGGEFGASYACRGSVEQVLPVDLMIPGCPPAPIDLLRGLLALFGRPAPIRGDTAGLLIQAGGEPRAEVGR